MGRLSHESSSSARSSLDNAPDNGEGLPLYSDITVTSPGDLTAPGDKATPDEVREFLVRLLIRNRSLHPDHARRVAAKWRLGTGRELVTYPPELYAEIFGVEDAWMVYKEAKLFIYNQKKEKKAREGSKVPPLWVGPVMLLVIELGVITGAVMVSVDHHEVLKVSLVFAAIFIGIALFGFAIATICESQHNEEAKIEGELAKGLIKAPTSSSS